MACSRPTDRYYLTLAKKQTNKQTHQPKQNSVNIFYKGTTQGQQLYSRDPRLCWGPLTGR